MLVCKDIMLVYKDIVLLIYKVFFKFLFCVKFLSPSNMGKVRGKSIKKASKKIVEQYFKDCIIDFCNDNNIITNNQHGSRKDYSTMTALADINHTLTTNYDSNKYSMVIQTDLSAAFDTVDHNILLD